MTDTQKAANIDVEISGRHIQVNEQTTIAELDEIIRWLNSMLAKEKSPLEVKKAIYAFMRQHHSFDLYIEALRAEGK